MKKIILLSAFTIFLMSNDLMAQMIVKVRPQRPEVTVIRPSKVYKNKVWLDGHWKWNRKTKSYQWVKGHWIRKQPNRTWVVGKWKKVPAGWKYNPGHWTKS